MKVVWCFHYEVFIYIMLNIEHIYYWKYLDREYVCFSNITTYSNITYYVKQVS